MLKNNLLVIIDGNAVMHRAYHGINRGFVPVHEGMPVGMVYGFGSTLLSVLEHLQPGRLAVTFDTKEKTFRHEMDDQYKAHREKAPDDFYPQLPLIDAMLEAANVPTLKKPGFESDDICGTLAVQGAKRGLDVRIVSGDLDFTQLVTDQVKLLKLNGKIDQSLEYGPAEVEARYGVRPDQMVDFKALTGDSSDNYHGVPGVGPKTAAGWIQQWGSIDGLLAHRDELPDRWREKITDHESYVRHCQKLAAIHTDVPVEEWDWEQTFEPATETWQEFLDQIRFRSLSNRLVKFEKTMSSPLTEKVSSEPASDSQMSLF